VEQYTLFANASTLGTPPVRALFFEFPNEPELFGVDRQFLIGRDILVTPVLTPNVTTVDGVYISNTCCFAQLSNSFKGIFPGQGSVTWRDWYTHDVVNSTKGANTTLSAPLGHINVHVRDGSAILLHAKPAYTIEETRQGPYSLLISQAADGHAFGSAYIDDGVSSPPTASYHLTFAAAKGKILIRGRGSFNVKQKLQTITVLGISSKPGGITVQGRSVMGWRFAETQGKLTITDLEVDLNKHVTIEWK
jgi:Alpha-glucosidases, family 31 of glycosyl hydrolases